MVCLDSVRREAITFLIFVFGISSYSASLEELIVTCSDLGAGEDVDLGAEEDVDLDEPLNSSTSLRTILPLGPEPLSSDKSIPFSAARLLAAGDAKILPT